MTTQTTPSASVLSHPVQKWPGHGHDSDFIGFIKGTLTISGVGTTTVTDPKILAGAHVMITPSSAKAATMIAGGANVTSGIYVSSVVDGSFVVTHDDHADAEGSTFDYIVFNTAY
jgi:hypothetical protein